MRKVIVTEWMTLDGVLQGPMAPEEDTDGGFTNGGWHTRYLDELSRKWALANIAEAGGFLLGRRTYETFAAYWPDASEEERIIAEPLNSKPKYVASTTLTEPLEWQHSRLLEGDVVNAVSTLKREDGGDLVVIGSSELARTLIEHNLVDELRVIIDPIVVGGGKRLFSENGELRPFRLTDSKVASTGAIITTYATQL